MLGLIVTGGIGNKDKTIHSGLDFLGFKPKIVTSSSFIFSNLILISIGKTLLSFSITVVGFSKLILYCLALQCGHFLTLFNLFTSKLISFLFALTPFSFSKVSNLPRNFLLASSSNNTLPHSLHVLLKKAKIILIPCKCITGLANSI